MIIVVQVWASVWLLECRVSLTVCYLKFLCLSNQKNCNAKVSSSVLINHACKYQRKRQNCQNERKWTRERKRQSKSKKNNNLK